MLGFDAINNWDAELKEMNKDKIGDSFHYLDTFLLLFGYAKVYFHLPFRQTEGIGQEDMSMEKYLPSQIIVQ